MAEIETFEVRPWAEVQRAHDVHEKVLEGMVDGYLPFDSDVFAVVKAFRDALGWVLKHECGADHGTVLELHMQTLKAAGFREDKPV